MRGGFREESQSVHSFYKKREETPKIKEGKHTAQKQTTCFHGVMTVLHWDESVHTHEGDSARKQQQQESLPFLSTRKT